MPDSFDVKSKPSKYLYSFSGADARVFTYFPSNPELIRPLDTVHTISISVHEAKGQARALGHRGIKGLARGVRTIAGSIILTVINDHPLRSVLAQYNEIVRQRGSHPSLGWSVDREQVGVGTMLSSYDLTTRMPTLLPPFDLAIQYVSEGSPRNRVGDPTMNDDDFVDAFINNFGVNVDGAGVLVRGIEFIDDGLVTSTNDIVSEMTFSFIACDYKPLAAFNSYEEFFDDPVSQLREDEQELQQALRAQDAGIMEEGDFMMGLGSRVNQPDDVFAATGQAGVDDIPRLFERLWKGLK